MKLCKPSRELFEEHYKEHKGKEIFDPLIQRILKGPTVAMVWEGDNIVSTCHKLRGVTFPSKAAPGTFRGDFS